MKPYSMPDSVTDVHVYRYLATWHRLENAINTVFNPLAVQNAEYWWVEFYADGNKDETAATWTGVSLYVDNRLWIGIHPTNDDSTFFRVAKNTSKFIAESVRSKMIQEYAAEIAHVDLTPKAIVV